MVFLLNFFLTILTSLTGKGWQIQAESQSFDKQTVYFSALKPGTQQYDLYYCTQSNNHWSEPMALPYEVNDAQSDDLWPSISPDEQELYFVRRSIDTSGKKPVWRQDIYLSKRNGKIWTKAQALIISDGGSQSPNILDDGKTLLFSSCKQVPDAKHPHYGIYYTRKTGRNNWLIPEPIALHESTDVHFLSPQLIRLTDGSYQLQALQQTIERKDTTYTRTTFSLPERMYPLPVLTLSGTVNDGQNGKRLPAVLSVKDAITQTLIAEYTTTEKGTYTLALAYGQMYSIDVTADGYSHRYLDYDCRELKENQSVVENITLTPNLSVTIYVFDAETNSSLGEEKKKLAINQLYEQVIERRGYESQTLTLDTRKAVLLPSSELDVLLTPGKAPLSVHLYDAESGAALKGNIVLTNQQREQHLTYDEAALSLRQGDTYMMAVNTVGYIFFDTLFAVPLSAEPLTMNIGLMPIRQSMILQLKNIHFETASSDLTEDSFTELDKVVRLLKDNPDLRIELSAHTDDQGTDAFNKRLSERRGESAKRYILRHGIAPERVTSKGYGKSHPLFPNDSEEHRAMNRRVEFKVTEI